MLGRRTAVVAVVALACSAQVACAAVPAPVAPPGPTQSAQDARAAGGPWPATGPLFSGPADALGDHFCTASVIDTPARDVVLTAAHCVASGDGTPPRTGMSFVPGYHDHLAPFGAWTVTRAVVDAAWQAEGDPDHDVALLIVDQDGAGPVEDVTGGYHLVTDPGASSQVDAIGYPDTADAPTVRSGVTSRMSPTQLQLDAPGLYDGVSGGPWLRDGDEVVAVTGGYEQGGVDPNVSYASYLGDFVDALLAEIGATTAPTDGSAPAP
jgi:V8-like Glu-specific endopeptidase